jgi:hypothetical protein
LASLESQKKHSFNDLDHGVFWRGFAVYLGRAVAVFPGGFQPLRVRSCAEKKWNRTPVSIWLLTIIASRKGFLAVNRLGALVDM